MADFRKLAIAALTAGILSGLLLSVLQYYLTQPLILAAEQFEAPATGSEHEWQPEDGWQRFAFTVLFNGLSGFGFALLLSAAIYWHGTGGYWRGLLWGSAGYLVFFAAPSLGLPPELPGTDSAALLSRQAWWLFTAALSAAGLYGLLLSKNSGLQIVGGILAATPHLIGAPHPEIAQALAPEALQQRFVVMTAFSNALFWLSLGALAGFTLTKLKL